MKALLTSHADTVIEQGDLQDPEYRARLKAWADAALQADGDLWEAMAEVLSAAVQLDLETPPWHRCRPGDNTLLNAIDTVLEALPMAGVRAFDKKQGG